MAGGYHFPSFQSKGLRMLLELELMSSLKRRLPQQISDVRKAGQRSTW